MRHLDIILYSLLLITIFFLVIYYINRSYIYSKIDPSFSDKKEEKFQFRLEMKLYYNGTMYRNYIRVGTLESLRVIELEKKDEWNEEINFYKNQKY